MLVQEKKAEEVSDLLSKNDISVCYYHAGLDMKQRENYSIQLD